MVKTLNTGIDYGTARDLDLGFGVAISLAFGMALSMYIVVPGSGWIGLGYEMCCEMEPRVFLGVWDELFQAYFPAGSPSHSPRGFLCLLILYQVDPFQHCPKAFGVLPTRTFDVSPFTSPYSNLWERLKMSEKRSIR